MVVVLQDSNSTPAEPAEPTRRCRRCRGEPQPISQFRPRENGKRHSVCNGCHRLAMATRRQKKRLRAVRSFISHASREQNWRRIESLLAKMFENFDGVEKLTEIWRRENALAQTQPHSPRVGRSIMAWANILIHASNNQPQGPSLNYVPDAELAERLATEMRRELANLITEHPEVLFRAAEVFGYTVIRPAADTVEADSSEGDDNRQESFFAAGEGS